MAVEATPLSSGGNPALAEAPVVRKNWFERTLGPDNYRIARGLATNPLSVTGIILIVLFVLIAALAPVLAPPLGRNPYAIPRDGF